MQTSQARDLSREKRDDPPQVVCQGIKLCSELHTLKPDQGFFEGFTNYQTAVIRQQDCVLVFNQITDSVSSVFYKYVQLTVFLPAFRS